MNKQILLEKEWEADDLIHFFVSNHHPYIELPRQQIKKLLQTNQLNKYGPCFCKTTIIQKFLGSIGMQHLIPDTYSKNFDKFYHRNIRISNFKNLQKSEFPIFIKSLANDKKISGIVIENLSQLNDIWEINDTNQNDVMLFYVSDVVKFASEHRLLVGNGKLYASAFQKGNKNIQIDSQFLDEIIQHSKNNFYCIDIGYLCDTQQWAIVEINPPFSLDDYGISNDKYFQFAKDFWSQIELTQPN